MAAKKRLVSSRESRVASKSPRRKSARAARNSKLATRSARAARRSKLATRSSRRGVLLLVVLSVLVLFLMVGTAFIITTKQSEKASKANAKAANNDARSAARGNLLDDALLQVLRDTDNPASVLQGHSLLGDLNGNDGFQALVFDVRWAASAPSANDDVTAGQMLQFEINGARNLTPPQDLSPTVPGNQSLVDFYKAALTASTVDDAYAGLVLTFMNGPARQISTRVVKYVPTGPEKGTVTVMAIANADGSLITDPTSLEGSRIVVNGRPFNGTGVGLNLAAAAGDAKLNAGISSLNVTSGSDMFPAPVALLPNKAFLPDPSELVLPGYTGSAAQQVYFPAGTSDWAGRGGADETYDAPDFQNMFLAAIQDDPEDNQNPGSGTLDDMVLPSFHRPELINYWNAQVAATSGPIVTNALLLRKVLLRPNHLDHKDFTGSNAQFENNLRAFNNDSSDATAQTNLLNSYVYGPWDVDNDNDGNRDSVWVDIGAPVMMGPNGKLVKPLAALLIVDLDGRANLNVHGTADLADFADGSADNPVDATATNGPIKLANGIPPFDNTVGAQRPNTPRGSGWGPADISLEAAIVSNNSDDSFKNLIDGVSIPTGGGTTRFVPGRPGRDNGAGRGRTYDGIAQIDRFGWPQWGGQFQRSTFAMPPDLRARYGTGLNAFGQPVLESTFNAEGAPGGVGQLTADSPYETPLYAEGVDGDNGLQSLDAPFSLAELEKVLRMYDADYPALASRLQEVAAIQTGERNRVTTDSWDLPAPNMAMPKEFEVMLAPLNMLDPVTNQPYRRMPRSTAELLEIRVRKALSSSYPPFPVPLSGDPTDEDSQAGRLRVIMRQILAPELASGTRLNINRPLGNGLDDNNNGVVDEPCVVDQNGNYVWGEGSVSVPEAAWRNTPTGYAADALNTNFLNAPFKPLDVTYDNDPNPGVVNDADAALQRQLLARHLYVMALTLSADAEYDGTRMTAPFNDPALARRLAQWAVNIVDFRDADGIMTPFEYDLNPFDGWNVGGDTTRGIDGDLRTTDDHAGPDPNRLDDDTFVWGAERTELLMTETLAWHDRRTDDLANQDLYPPTADPHKLTDPNAQDFDIDYDQLVRPRGAFFVELYNPNPAMPGASADTHDIRTNGDRAFDWGVNLRAVDLATQNSPVWRIAIYKRPPPPPTGNQNTVLTSSLWDPDERNTLELDPITKRYVVRHPSVAMDRSVYFTTFDPESRLAPGKKWDEDGVAFFADSAHPDNVGSVRPGRYLVVGGGRDIDGTGVYTSGIGDVVSGGQNMPGSIVDWRPRRRIDLSRASVGGNAPVRLVDYKADASTFKDTTFATPFNVEAPTEADMLSTGVAQPFESGGSPAPTSVADVAIIDQVWDLGDNYDDGPGAATGQRKIRRRPLTLSEPALGYIDRFGNAEWNDKNGCYRNPGTQTVPLDIPLDGPVVNDAKSSKDVRNNLDARVDDDGNSIWSPQYPIPRYLSNPDPALCRVNALGGPEDPRVSYAFVYLQRLANPTLPWNPEPAPGADPTANGHDPLRQVNPYLTVDGMSADLSVFNGRSYGNQKPGYEEDKLNDPAGFGTDTSTAMAPTFSSLERGYSGLKGPTPTYQPSIWIKQRPSLGNQEPFVRDNRYKASSSSGIVIKAPPFCTLGFLGTPLQTLDGNASAAKRRLQPEKPPHWLTWNNRPYVSGNELMLAPRVRSSMIMREFSDVTNVETAYSPYVPPDNDKLQAKHNMTTLTWLPYGAYAQLESLFYEDSPGVPADGLPLHLYRLLDFVGTPSLYAGATNWLNPMTVGVGPGAPADDNPATSFDDPRTDRQAPFNNVSSFREPGRVNLNTIFSDAVYAGIFQADDAGDVDPEGDDDAHPGPEWDNDDDSLVRSRRGYGAGNADMLALDPTSPTFFSNPFRSSSAGDLVPLQTMVRYGVEVTLARSTSASPDTIDQDPLFAAKTEEPYRDMRRNPYFRFAPMIRVNNLTTTRSNVFAVWVTIGFFEVEPADRAEFNANNSALSEQELTDMYNRVYPDGYTFTTEDGLDEGNVSRLRGFYIIDRSRPAAFLPGVDANVENTIRLHRRIE